MGVILFLLTIITILDGQDQHSGAGLASGRSVYCEGLWSGDVVVS